MLSTSADVDPLIRKSVIRAAGDSRVTLKTLGIRGSVYVAVAGSRDSATGNFVIR